MGHIVIAMKILKRKKALQAESGGLRDTIWLWKDAYIWWNQRDGKESLRWGKQRQEGRNRIVCGVGERALGTWCMRVWGHISIDLRQNLRERTWMPDFLWRGLGHLAREVGGLCVETMTLTLSNDTDWNPQKGTFNVTPGQLCPGLKGGQMIWGAFVSLNWCI